MGAPSGLKASLGSSGPRVWKEENDVLSGQVRPGQEGGFLPALVPPASNHSSAGPGKKNGAMWDDHGKGRVAALSR